MAEHTPIHRPGEAYTATASADITGGQILVASGDDTVAPSGGASVAFAGIAAHDALNGEKVTVLTGGIHEVTASGAIAAGAVVVTASTGRVATLGDTTYSQVIAVALKAAASNKVKIRLFR